MDTLFDQNLASRDSGPLAERVRPGKWSDFKGLADHPQLKKIVEQIEKLGVIPNLILWGPPGSGKTTFAQIVAKNGGPNSTFIQVSATDTGAKELKAIGDEGRLRLASQSVKTILFVDEIHRLNKSQQDCLLPSVEKGWVTLIGATTENPSFELNGALLSRTRVVILKGHTKESFIQILEGALQKLDPNVSWDQIYKQDLKSWVFDHSVGDARRGLNLLESIFNLFLIKNRQALAAEDLADLNLTPAYSYDKSGENHFDLVSALIKSIRGSDPDSALYYMARMLEAGEDPLFIARRLVILASEDVGNADPKAIQIAVSVKDALEFIGMPEGAICLAQAVTYLASAPKSNRSYLGWKGAQELARKYPNTPVPIDLRNAATGFMKQLGYGKDYKYAHDGGHGLTDQVYWPKEIPKEPLYEPAQIGYEKYIKDYLAHAEKLRKGDL